MKKIILFAFLLSLLIGCSSPTAVEPTTVAPSATALGTAPATATAAPLPTVTTAPTATPTPVIPTATPIPPTATPLPNALLVVPSAWQSIAQTAVASLAPPHWQWQIETSDDPASWLKDGRAQIVILSDNRTDLLDGRFLIAQTPIALTVPFTTYWQDISQADAEAIFANGHALVQVQPWDSLTPERRALRVDGRHPTAPDYPFQNRWYLQAAPGAENALAELTAVWPAPPDSIAHLAAVGDLMLDRSLGYAISNGKLAYPFAAMGDLLTAPDLTLGNLECSLGDVGQPAAKSYTFQAPPAAAEALALGGFDVLTLANNHAMDYGPEALLQGLGLLEAQGIGHVGAGANAAAAHAPVIRDVKGIRIAILGYVNVPVEGRSNFDTATWTATDSAPGLAWADPAIIQADVTAVRAQADIVIVLLHSGYEYVETPSDPQKAAAYAAIESGADMVIGHHAHILQGIEFYQGHPIVYGLGNFAFEIDGDPATAVLNIWLDKGGIRQIEIIPALIQFGGQPRPAADWEAAPILQNVYRLTTLLNPR